MTANRISSGFIRSHAANWDRPLNTVGYKAKLILPQYVEISSVFDGLPFPDRQSGT